MPGPVRCVDCGFLTTFGLKGQRHPEIPQASLEGDSRDGGVNEPLCFVWREDFWDPLDILANRDCSDFTPHKHGFDPKEHFERQEREERREQDRRSAQEQQEWLERMERWKFRMSLATSVISGATVGVLVTLLAFILNK